MKTTPTAKSKYENPDHYCSEPPWAYLRRLRSKCVPAFYSHAAARRVGRRIHESTVRQPLLLRGGGIADCRRSTSAGREVCATRFDAPGSCDREHLMLSYLP